MIGFSTLPVPQHKNQWLYHVQNFFCDSHLEYDEQWFCATCKTGLGITYLIQTIFSYQQTGRQYSWLYCKEVRRAILNDPKPGGLENRNSAVVVKQRECSAGCFGLKLSVAGHPTPERP